MRIPVRKNLKLAWERLTADRLTIIFIVLSLIYCILQTVFAIKSLLINTQVAEGIKNIYGSQNISYVDYVHYSRRTGMVNVCQTNPQTLNYTACPTVFPISLATNGSATTATNAIVLSKLRAHSKRAIEVRQSGPDPKGQRNMVITGLQGESVKAGQIDTVTASPTCMQVMKWPLQILLNGKREDIAFVFFQAWVFGLSVVAVLNQSVPHVFASLISHLLVAIWASYEFLDTLKFQADYDKLVRGINAPASFRGEFGRPGACDGQDLLPNFFGPRKTAQLVVAIINFVGLLGSMFFTYRLYHAFGWQSFKRIGASVLVNRLYRLALTLFILIQLSFFFVATAMCLWVDQMYNGLFGVKGVHSDLYKAGHFIVFLLLVPWLVLGWISVRRELRKCMLLFIALSFVFILLWIGECFSLSWRLTYVHWTFFASMQTCAIVLTVATFILAIICRIYCFGHGLSQYLQYQVDDVSGDLNPAPDVMRGLDQIQFPSLHALGDEELGRRLGHAAANQHYRSDSEATLTNNKGSSDEDDMKARKKTHRKGSSFDTLAGEDAVELPSSYGSEHPHTSGTQHTGKFSIVNLTPRPVGSDHAVRRDCGHTATAGDHASRTP